MANYSALFNNYHLMPSHYYSKEELVPLLANAIKEMQETHYEGTYYWHIGTDDEWNNWAIVMAFMDYDNDGNEELYAKLAYQPSNSIMQCDYDIDWTMPYDDETGLVDDNEVTIYSAEEAEEVVDWLLSCYHTYF